MKISNETQKRKLNDYLYLIELVLYNGWNTVVAHNSPSAENYDFYMLLEHLSPETLRSLHNDIRESVK